MSQYEPKNPLELAILGGYNQLVKDAFGEALAEEPLYELVTVPRVTMTKTISVHQWLLQKFKVGGIDSQLYGLHQGCVQGLRDDKGIFWISHLGTVFDFSLPSGFVVTNTGKLEIIPLKNSGHQPSKTDSSPLFALLREEIQNSKLSKFAKNMNALPRKNKYQMSGLNAVTLESELNPALHVIPRHGKTIVTANFISYAPDKGKTKGYQVPIPVEGKDRKHEVGATYPPNFGIAYHLLRTIQDIPDNLKADSEFVADIPQWGEKGKGQGVDIGGLSSFLALELARQAYAPDREPLTLEEYVTRKESLNTIIQPLVGKHGDVNHIFETKHKK
ncbi:MAG: hypothetical protein JW779_08055 [Candidatus Thorarchaeota archaeon]|nr:hypothetical protein [Candidatus Thorarchaeota archaeon]